MPQYEGTVNAPEFPVGLDWINVREPITLKQLRGRIVLLDFWTYCCINCMHIIPDLKRLEEKYPDELVVIGVHSAKFPGERDTHNILQAVLRYGIEHPVINDHSMALWQQYTVRAWPTVVLIDPAGKVVGAHTGEDVFRAVDPVIAKMRAGVVECKPVPTDPIARHMPQSLLSFPGKILADEATGRLFIADSNHDRIIIATAAGAVVDVVGGFNRPQGMCLLDGVLYIADTGNDAIAAIRDGRIETIAEGLNSPWDVVAVGQKIYIAMAGRHQVWKLDVKTGECRPFAGSGAEGLVDGPGASAAFAQPSGIATDGQRLYVADSETSSIRVLTTVDESVVSTIVGRGLFDFGDRDGVGDEVRLQHPLGIAFQDGELFIADSYNNKIKRVSPGTRQVRTVAGGFAEPGGLSIMNGKLYVADTNNHVIRVVDLHNPGVTTLMLEGLEKLKPPAAANQWIGQSIQFPAESVRAGALKIVINSRFPEGLKLNHHAPNRFLIRSDASTLTFDGGQPAVLIRSPRGFPVEVTADIRGSAGLAVLAELYYCHSGDEGLCFYAEVLGSIALHASEESGSSSVRLDLPV